MSVEVLRDRKEAVIGEVPVSCVQMLYGGFLKDFANNCTGQLLSDTFNL